MDILATEEQLMKDAALKLTERAARATTLTQDTVITQQLLSSEFRRRGVAKKAIKIRKGTHITGYTQ